MGQFFPSRNLLMLTQNNTPYSNKTNPTHPLTTESSPPYTKRIVGLNIYTNLPSTPALQHNTYTHIDTIPANHATRDTTPAPSEKNDPSSETRTYEKTRVISLIPSPHKRHHLRGRRAHQLPPHQYRHYPYTLHISNTPHDSPRVHQPHHTDSKTSYEQEDVRGGGQLPTLMLHSTSARNITSITSYHTPPQPTTTTDNPILAIWQHAFLTLSPEEFTAFTHIQTYMETPSCPDPSGHSELLHTHITHFTYGEYQSIHDIHTSLAGIYMTLNIIVSTPILSQPDLDNILLRGTPPTTWTSRHRFGPTHAHPGPLHASSLCEI
jgi:hypothetical protein